MIFVIEPSGFKKKVNKLSPKIKRALAERLRLFASEPFSPLLNNHGLSGARQDQRSINITGDWRLIFEQVDNEAVRLLDVDTHHNLYGK